MLGIFLNNHFKHYRRDLWREEALNISTELTFKGNDLKGWSVYQIHPHRTYE